MSGTWQSGAVAPTASVGAAGWLRLIWRGTLLGLLVFGGLLVLLVLRLIERPLWRQHRPFTPFIAQFVSRGAFVIMGLKFTVQGTPMAGLGAVVANHSSWLDIFALNARNRIYFVSKAEVAGWPGIGWLARASGTVFIRRRSSEAGLHRDIIGARLKAGHRLVFFPEGTSTDGIRVLPFKSSLFEAFFMSGLRADMSIQPVTVVYRAPDGEATDFYGWWGDMDMAPHLLKILASRRQGAVALCYHPPVRVCDFADRKALAKACEATVRAGVRAGLSGQNTGMPVAVLSQ
ncbi:MAG: lysophospholipid acyltransferase family protein [Paracoccaceae bacterium]